MPGRRNIDTVCAFTGLPLQGNSDIAPITTARETPKACQSPKNSSAFVPLLSTLLDFQTLKRVSGEGQDPRISLVSHSNAHRHYMVSDLAMCFCQPGLPGTSFPCGYKELLQGKHPHHPSIHTNSRSSRMSRYCKVIKPWCLERNVVIKLRVQDEGDTKSNPN